GGGRIAGGLRGAPPRAGGPGENRGPCPGRDLSRGSPSPEPALHLPPAAGNGAAAPEPDPGAAPRGGGHAPGKVCGGGGGRDGSESVSSVARGDGGPGGSAACGAA